MINISFIFCLLCLFLGVKLLPVGCFKDVRNHPAMRGDEKSSSAMTNDMCVEYCLEKVSTPIDNSKFQDVD